MPSSSPSLFLVQEGSGAATRTYSYDGRGRLLTRTGNLPMTFGWDTFGHLRSTATAGVTTRYQYDPAGRLVAIDNPGTAEDEYFVYRNGLEPVAWRRGDRRQYYVYASMPHVPDLIYEDIDEDPDIDNVYRVLTDERGSVRSVLRIGDSTEVVQLIEYTANGNPVFALGSEFFQPFGFAGAIWLRQARLYHMGARDYDPRLGRWISKDPIRFDGGTNLYVYCEGDPVNRIDPSGLYQVGETIDFWEMVALSVNLGRKAVQSGTEYAGVDGTELTNCADARFPNGVFGESILYAPCPRGSFEEIRRNAQHYVQANGMVRAGLPFGATMAYVGGWNALKIVFEIVLAEVGLVAFGHAGAMPHDSPATLADFTASYVGALEARNSIDGGSLVELLGLGAAVEPPGRFGP